MEKIAKFSQLFHSSHYYVPIQCNENGENSILPLFYAFWFYWPLESGSKFKDRNFPLSMALQYVVMVIVKIYLFFRTFLNTCTCK